MEGGNNDGSYGGKTSYLHNMWGKKKKPFYELQAWAQSGCPGPDFDFILFFLRILHGGKIIFSKDFIRGKFIFPRARSRPFHLPQQNK